MRVYVTRSKKLTLYITVNDVKSTVVFNRGIREENLMALMLRDKDEIKALESMPEFNKEFWFYEEHPDVQPAIVPKTTKVIYYKPGTEPASINTTAPGEIMETSATTDYPDITTAQKAKLLLIREIKGTTLADYPNTLKILEVAKAHNITFSNWKTNG